MNEMSLDEILQIGQLVGILLGVFGVTAHLIKLGRIIGRLEQLIEIHSAEIEKLHKEKLDKSICAAYRDKHK